MGGGRSITIGLGQMILNGELVDLFISNDYLMMMSSIENLYLVVDPETSIVRDVMITYMPISGAYCFSDLQTEWASELGGKLINGNPNVSSFPVIIGSLGINIAYGLSELAASLTIGEVVIGGLTVGELFAAGALGGLIGLAIAADIIITLEYPDIGVPGNLHTIPGLGTMLYFYSLQSIIRGEGEPLTPRRLGQSSLWWSSILIAIAEDVKNKDIKDQLREKAEKGDYKGAQELINIAAGQGRIPGDPRDNDDYMNIGERMREDYLDLKNAMARGDLETAIEKAFVLSVETGAYELAITGEVIVELMNRKEGKV